MALLGDFDLDFLQELEKQGATEGGNRRWCASPPARRRTWRESRNCGRAASQRPGCRAQGREGGPVLFHANRA